MMNQEHWHKHAKLLGLKLQRQEFDERNVFVVVFVGLLKQNQSREFPRIIISLSFSDVFK
jgi:hypothetical protein